MKYLRKILKEPEMAGIYFMVLTARLWPAELYIKIFYYLHLKKWPDLKPPHTFSEKLNWLKLHDRNPLYTKLTDKYAVKDYVSKKIGVDKVVPLLGVWNSFDEIDFDHLPERFVLKCTHDSGGFMICKDKSTFSKVKARSFFNRELRKNYYWNKREWPYKDIQPRIIAEKYLEDGNGDALTDYKFFCFNGEPKMMYISKDVSADPRTDFFDMDWNYLPFKFKDPHAEVRPSMPDKLEEMKEIARTLSKGIPHVRVDMYLINNHIFFGEMTFFHLSGFFSVTPDEWDDIIGGWLDLKKYDA